MQGDSRISTRAHNLWVKHFCMLLNDTQFDTIKRLEGKESIQEQWLGIKEA